MKEIEKNRQNAVKENAQKEKVYITPETQERIRQKEYKLLEKKWRLMSANKEKSNQRQKFLEENIMNMQQSEKYSQVKSKLKDETMAMVHKKREKFDKDKDQARWADNMAGGVIRTQGRAQVSWRQGV